MRKLRNEIVHIRTPSNQTLLDFGETLWREITRVYAEDVPALYNTLSYVIQTNDLFELKPDSNSQEVTEFFSKAYNEKNSGEKAMIICKLIPIMSSSFYQKFNKKQKSEGQNSTNESSLK